MNLQDPDQQPPKRRRSKRGVNCLERTYTFPDCSSTTKIIQSHELGYSYANERYATPITLMRYEGLLRHRYANCYSTRVFG